MRRALLVVLGLAGLAALVVLTAGSGSSPYPHYWVQLDNAFGLTQGGDFKVAGVRAGTITGFKLDPSNNKALVGVRVTQPGFGSFRSDVFCQSRPQSLIGEYFLDCDPGTARRALKNGAVIPVSQTRSTVAPDLVNNILRLPYRERLRLIINELGAGVAGNGQALNEALRRANPALRDVDRLLATLAQQRGVIANLTTNADTVVTALADNKQNVSRFVVEARNTAEASARRRGDLQATFHKLPGFLEELRPTMAALGRTADAQRPALARLDRTAPELTRFLGDLVPFSQASTPAFRALGRASVTGRGAVVAARPTVAELNAFAGRTPDVATNLAIILHDLDDRSRAVESDPRAAQQIGRPGTKAGYTGLEALLQYAYNQALAINTFDANGQHVLRVDAFTDKCAPYRNVPDLKRELARDPSFKRCLSTLGPTQPGINAPDPSTAFPPGVSASSARSASAAVRAARARPAARHRRASSGGSTTGAAAPALDPLGAIGRAIRSQTSTPQPPGGVPGLPLPRSSGPSAGDGSPLLDYLLAP